jgi:toxin-antitoxin system PIN domain toxin
LILIDANLLLYAYDTSSSYHDRARTWLERTITEDDVGLAVTTLLAFVRIATAPTVFARPFAVGEAIGIVEEWLALPTVVLVEPTRRHWAMLSEIAVAGQARGPLVMDAHLAALAMEHGAVLCTTDRDFARFDGLRWRDPLREG